MSAVLKEQADFATSGGHWHALDGTPRCRQLAAYRMGLGMPEARCAICYVSSVVPEARLIELDSEELEQGWAEFKALLTFYKAANRL